MRGDRDLGGGRVLVHRHGLPVRAAHWLNALAFAVLLLSGLQILCAHPAFYLGEASRFSAPVAAIATTAAPDGASRGRLQILGWRLDTTGVLGASRDPSGQWTARAVPGWATLPSELNLGAGRRWHFFFAWVFVLNGLLYLAGGILSGRLRRTLAPGWGELRAIGPAIAAHLRLRFAHGEEARAYNVLQKLAYLGVVLALCPLMALTGLAMSPTIDARLHGLTVILGGRQTARTLHFLTAGALVLFLTVHLAMVVLAGPLNEMRAMLTGWMVIRTGRKAR